MFRKDITVFVDMDGVLADFVKRHREMLEKEPDIKYPQSQHGFFRNLDPIDDSIRVYLWLHKHFNTHVLTAPSYLNPLCYTEKRDWVGNHLGEEPAERMIICGYKNLCKGDYLIDDYDKGKGQDLFDGELIHFHRDTNNWTHIQNYFSTKYNIPIL